MNQKTKDKVCTRLAEAMYPTVMFALSGQEPDTATAAAKRHARAVTRNLVYALSSEGIVHDLSTRDSETSSTAMQAAGE